MTPSPVPARSRTRTRLVAAVLASAALALAACGGDDGDGDAASSATTAAAADTAAATTAAPDTTAVDTTAAAAPATTEAAADTTEAPATTLAPLVVPDGVTLRVADQQGTLERPLATSGLAEQVQAGLEYATFVGGPAVLEAFNAGAVDIGYVGDTPPIFAQAQGQDLVIVAAWRFSGKVAAVVAPPGKEIASVADLEGKKFAYPRGTALQALALRALEEVDLTEADIEQVEVSVIDVAAALQSGDVDAGVLVEPLLTNYLRDNPEATVVRDAEGLATGLQLVITTREVLDDPDKAAAVGDFVTNLAASFVWAAENPDEAIAAFAEANQISIEEAQVIFDRNGTQLFVPLDDGVIEPLQSLADLFFSAGVIPEQLDVSQLFDDRFDPYVAPYTQQS